MKLSENIRFFRKKTKLTQEKLAELISCSIDTLQRWENGTREPKASDIVRLCEIFYCNETELLNGPVSNDWELRIRIAKEGVIEVSGLETVADINVGDNGIAITLSGNYDLWADSTKFEEKIIEKLRDKREEVLEFYKKTFRS